MARPKKTLDDLPENWQGIMEEIASNGGSELECRVKLGISDDLWYRLKDEEPEFSRTVKRCKALCQIWWESLGRNMATGAIEKGNATTWIFNMKNRFGWRDKQEVEQRTDNVNRNLNTDVELDQLKSFNRVLEEACSQKS